MEESDIEKIAEQVNKKRKPYRWYNDPEKAKKVGPVLEAFVYVFGFGLFVTAFLLTVETTTGLSFPGVVDTNDQFTNIAIAKMDCQSLKSVSLEYAHSEKESRFSHSYIQADINTELLARC